MRKKILLIQNEIPHYRKPIYNLLARDYDLTVIHSGNESKGSNDTYMEKIVPKKKIGPFIFQNGIISESRKSYDVIIAMADLHWPINIYLLFVHSQKKRFIWWGAWFTDKILVDKIKVFLAWKADANIFYCEDDRNQFSNAGIPEVKLFVANNTIDVGPRFKAYENNEKNRIIFVGTLNPRKENEKLIKAFHKIKNDIDSKITLTIIGEGEDKAYLKELTDELELNTRVEFKGKIIHADRLKKYYSEALVSVSYGQAGLSVLQSLGFGVPFITKREAISGGEISNIIDGYNGFLCDGSIEDLSKKLLNLCKNHILARDMGKNAFDHYTKKCTIENMTEGFKAAIS